jgi:hypothetical protein
VPSRHDGTPVDSSALDDTTARCGRFCRPCGAGCICYFYPGLAPGAAFWRRFAAGDMVTEVTMPLCTDWRRVIACRGSGGGSSHKSVRGKRSGVRPPSHWPDVTKHARTATVNACTATKHAPTVTDDARAATTRRPRAPTREPGLRRGERKIGGERVRERPPCGGKKRVGPCEGGAVSSRLSPASAERAARHRGRQRTSIQRPACRPGAEPRWNHLDRSARPPRFAVKRTACADVIDLRLKQLPGHVE